MRHFLKFFIIAAAASPAFAADKNGQFAIKGAGAKSCAGFVKAWDEGSPDLAQYGGWISGWITGLNQFAPGLYDAAPWQSAETLLGMTYSVCQQVPEPETTNFLLAAGALMERLSSGRLPERSELEGVRRGNQGFAIYLAVLEAAVSRLNELGYEAGDPKAPFGEQASSAFLDFQKAGGLEPSGLPDQRTLFALFVAEGAAAE